MHGPFSQALLLEPRDRLFLCFGRIFDAVVGGLESNEFKRQSRIIAQIWQQAGAQTRYQEIAGTNHFTVIELLADPQSAMTARVAELAQQIKA